VVEMLRKRRVEMRDLQVEVEGWQADDAPWPYERIALHFRVECERLSVGALERVIRLAVVRYCGALATMRGVAAIEATMELVGGDAPAAGRLPVRLDVAVAETVESSPANDE
jgi:putative redox protein